MVCAAGKLLAKEPELKANFSRAQGAASNAKANKVARFLPNPEANWGPRPKHGRPVKASDSTSSLRPLPSDHCPLSVTAEQRGSIVAFVLSAQQDSAVDTQASKVLACQ